MGKVNAYIVKVYNFVISRRWINRNNAFCRKIRKMLFHNICHECNAEFGKLNPDKTFYLIRCPQETMGLFGVFNYVIEHLKTAEKRNAEPIIDWQHYPNSSLIDDQSVGKENPWEYYFKQPVEVSLVELYHSKNVIMSGGSGLTSLSETRNHEELKNSHRLIEKYVKLNEKTAAYIDHEYHRLGMDKKRVLGVLCRGTDFTSAKPKGHSICPTAKEMIAKIEEKEKEWGIYDEIFLATEDDVIFREMKEYFGDKLVYCQKHRIENTQGKWLNELYDSKEYQGKKRNLMLEYLASIYLLAKCDALIAPNVGGTLGALRIKGSYENSYIFQLGHY